MEQNQPRGGPQRSDLAAWRVHRGVTQTRLAAAVGLSVATYRRLERGQLAHPPLAYLANCAIALGCTLDDLHVGPLLEWTALDDGARQPPERYRLWASPVEDWDSRPA